MLKSNIFKMFREAKFGYEVDFETASIQNIEKKSFDEYFIIRSSKENSYCKHIQIFNNSGICVFQQYNIMNEKTEVTAPVLDVEVQNDETTDFWKVRYSQSPNKEYPQNIRLIGATTYVSNGIHSVFRKNEILEQNPSKKAIFYSELLHYISFMKDNIWVSVESSIVIDTFNGREYYYLSVTAKDNKSLGEHLQVFNSFGNCVFSGTSSYADYNEKPTEPVVNVLSICEDWTSGMWGNRFASYNYNAELPKNLKLLSTTQFINDGIFTVLYYGEVACQQGECNNCNETVFSDIKRPICPNCGHTCALT